MHIGQNLWESTVYIFGCSCVGEKGTLHNFFAAKKKCECFSCFYFYFISKRHKLHWGNQCHLREMINVWSCRRMLTFIDGVVCARIREKTLFQRGFDYLIDKKAPTDSILTAWRCFHIPFIYSRRRKTLFHSFTKHWYMALCRERPYILYQKFESGTELALASNH